ncbi:MAG: ABC transporter substrate-binding protein [Lachnospiraceae bacterium]|nr:ABC transporter substrate-binding protein [Lachnospiraceae bacterium]
MRKIIISLSLILLIFLSACGSNDSFEDIELLDNIYYKTEFLTEINLNRIRNFSGFDDKIVIIGSFTDEKKEEAVKAITYDEDGNQLSEIIFSPPDKMENEENGWFDAAYIDENGFIWFLYSQTIETDGVLGDGESYIDCYDQTGNHIKTVKLLQEQPNLYKTGIKDFIIGDDNFFYICTDNRYTAVFDSTGNLIYEPQNLKTIFKLPDGRILAEMATRGVNFETFFREIKAAAKELGENLQFDTTWDGNNYISIYYISGDEEYEFLESTESKIFGHNLKDEMRVELIDRTKQNITQSRNDTNKYVVMLNSFIFVIEAHIMPEAGQKVKDIYTLVRLKNSDIPPDANKKNITLATMKSNFVLKDTIIDFNKNNSEYYIEIKEYWKEGQLIADTLTELNLDLASGKIPDILMIDHGIPINSYGSKGLFVDLYEYIDKDPELNRNDYLPNILKMQETDGKLYSIAAGFMIETVVSPVSLYNEGVSGKTRLTWDDFTTLLDKKYEVKVPIASRYANHMSKKHILQNAIRIDMNIFIDFETKKCNFNTSEFITVLKNIDRYFPEPYINVGIDDYLEGKVVFRNDTIFGFLETKVPELYYFGEPITYIGFPTINAAAGSFAILNYPMAISAKSEVKDGAWEYVKSIITDFQFVGVKSGANMDKSGQVAGFPIHSAALKEMAEAVKISTGEKFTRTYDGITLTYDPVLTDEDVDKILELIYSLEFHDNRIERGVMEIVLEEADFYFLGKKTAEEVADIIQSRVNIYLAEIE